VITSEEKNNNTNIIVKLMMQNVNKEYDSKKQTYGFNTKKPAPGVAELKNFENDMFYPVKNVKFKQNIPNTLQNTLKQHMNEMKRENLILIYFRTVLHVTIHNINTISRDNITLTS
jgi:hypothetical protein